MLSDETLAAVSLALDEAAQPLVLEVAQLLASKEAPELLAAQALSRFELCVVLARLQRLGYVDVPLDELSLHNCREVRVLPLDRTHLELGSLVPKAKLH